jgi:hypothetical protein
VRAGGRQGWWQISLMGSTGSASRADSVPVAPAGVHFLSLNVKFWCQTVPLPVVGSETTYGMSCPPTCLV